MIRFGILGAARIAPSALVDPCKEEPRASVTVVGARDLERAKSFAREHAIPHAVQGYQAVLDHPDVDAIYIGLPISAHKEWAIKALRAGKPVLCEKSFALNETEAQAMADVAEETGLTLMDAFHYRYHPVFRRAKEIYDSGALGTIRQIDALFQVAITDETDIRMTYETGGGVMMDIGCYPISWVRHISGLEPVELRAVAEEGPPDVDLYMKVDMRLANDIVATAIGDMRPDVPFKAELVVRGDRGELVVTNPLAPQHGHRITHTLDGHSETETLSRRATYAYQLDAFLDAVEGGVTPITDARDATLQMRTLDRCYKAAGMKVRGT